MGSEIDWSKVTKVRALESWGATLTKGKIYEVEGFDGTFVRVKGDRGPGDWFPDKFEPVGYKEEGKPTLGVQINGQFFPIEEVTGIYLDLSKDMLEVFTSSTSFQVQPENCSTLFKGLLNDKED